MRYLAAIFTCEVAAIACMGAGFAPPMPGNVFTAWAFAGHMAAALSCFAIAAFDLIRAIRGA